MTGMTVSFEDFQKIELRIGKILEAEKVPASEKLLKMQVDLGETNEDGTSKLRQIVAGIGKVYEPESLVGKELLFIANLEPRTIMGIESQGMILAAQDETGPVVLVPDRTVPPGAALK